jgi:hypothetical protein
LLRELVVVVDLDQQYSADDFRMDVNDSDHCGNCYDHKARTVRD